MSPSRISNASTEFYYNFYLTAVIIDLCLILSDSTRILIVLDKPEDRANLDLDNTRGFISHDAWFVIDPDLDVYDEVIQSNGSRVRRLRGLDVSQNE